MGTAMMGTGEASGEQRAIVAAEEAIVNPLLDDVTLKGAKSLLLSITGGRDLTLWEVDEAANRVRQEVDPDANIIVGATFDEALGDKVRVSIVASGMARSQPQPRAADAPTRLDAAASRPTAPKPTARRLPPPPERGHRRRGDGSATPASSDVVARGRRAPGDVYIQEGPPQLSPLPPATRGKNRASSAPRRCSTPRRGGRPVPAVEDFPPHAQREYWAKTRRERAARRSAGAAVRVPAATRSARAQDQPAASPGSGQRGRREGEPDDAQLPKHSSSRNGAGDGEEQVDLPVFFGRDKR